MAAGSLTISLTNGQSLSVYLAAGQAVGTSPVCSLEAVASATVGTTDFIPKSDCCIRDMIGATSTAGQMEVFNVSKSVRTGRFINQVAANYAVTVPNRVIPKICFRGGQTYRFIQTVLQA